MTTKQREAREEHVATDTAARVARAYAGYADHATGRNARPTNAKIADELKISVRQLQRAKRLLQRSELMVETQPGRSIMTRSTRLEAWRNGSAHRRLAATYALTEPRATARVIHRPRRSPVDDVAPPPVSEGERVKSPDLRFFEGAKPERMNGAARRTHSRRRPPARTPATARHHRLVAGLQRSVPWLAGVSPRRLTSLHRFARQRWTERDVLEALDGVLRARGWRVPEQLTQPAAYLAALLRDVDEHDRPGALREAQLEEERRREWVWATTFGERLCAHGQPAGDLPHPVDGHLACPYCRRAP